MTSLSASRQSEIKAWEEEIVSCDHIRNIQQGPEKVVSAGKAMQHSGTLHGPFRWIIRLLSRHRSIQNTEGAVAHYYRFVLFLS